MLVGLAALAALVGLGGLVLAFSSAAPVSTTGPIPFNRDADPMAFCRSVQYAVATEQFASLEATAKAARSLQDWFPGGETELHAFYVAFRAEQCGPENGTESDAAAARIQHLEHWLARKSDPLTASIALAETWEDYAWIGRGRDFANTVSQDQWRVFGQRARTAAGYMKTLDPSRDPQAYLVLLDLARDFNVPRPQIDALFAAARKAFPTYIHYYSTYANLLEPKWFGRPGDLARYIRSLLADPGGDAGAVAYSRAAEYLVWDLPPAVDVYADLGLDWKDVQHAFAVREQRYGLNQYGRIVLCYFAFAAGDRGAARAAFRGITHLNSWPNGGMHDFYLTALPWIMAKE
jgi:hypothetical protein